MALDLQPTIGSTIELALRLRKCTYVKIGWISVDSRSGRVYK
jgi:hypothetical protein